MKKIVLLFMLPLLALMLFIACRGDNDDKNNKVQLVKTITIYERVSWSLYFEYDEKDRVTSIFSDELDEKITFIYSGDDFVKVLGFEGTKECSKNGNTITILDGKTTTILELNSDEYPIKAKSSFEYYDHLGTTQIGEYHYNVQYLDGNLVYVSINDVKRCEYKYDNKKTPFYNCKTPKWFLIFYCLVTGPEFSGYYGVKNNVTEAKFGNPERYDDTIERSYEYDANGFPTKIFCNGKLEATFTYY